MFKKIFALALVLVLVAICTRRPFDAPLSGRLPNTCNTAQFASTVAQLDALRDEQLRALARVEAAPANEPFEYSQRWKREQEALTQLASKAAAEVREPRCLAHAKALFIRYLEETAKALELRAPDRDFAEYRRARESAESIHAQYVSELRLQEKNRL